MKRLCFLEFVSCLTLPLRMREHAQLCTRGGITGLVGARRLSCTSRRATIGVMSEGPMVAIGQARGDDKNNTVFCRCYNNAAHGAPSFSKMLASDWLMIFRIKI